MINTFYFHLSTFNFHIMLYERTLGQWLEHWAETTPDKEYIVYSDRNLRFTWSQFNRRVDDMAKGLIAIGVERGTHVGIWAANVPDWLTLLYACAKIGAVYVTVNTNYKQSELEYLCQNSDMHTLCIVNGEKDSDFVQMTYTMLPELKTCQRGHLKSERFPYMKNVIYVGQEKHRGMYNTAEILLLGNNIEDSRLNELKSQVTCHDVVNMQYTSGTTGFPKGVMLTHYNIANNGFLTGEHMKFTADDKLCVCVPLFHCFGVVLATMNCLTHGCTEVMVERFNPLVVLASIHKERCTALYGVPTMFIAELNHPMFDMFDMSSLRTGIMAGSLCPVELMKQVEEKMYMKVTSVYGLTEAAPGMTATRIDDPFDVRCNTVGHDFEHTEVKVIDPETGEECPVCGFIPAAASQHPDCRCYYQCLLPSFFHRIHPFCRDTFPLISYRFFSEAESCGYLKLVISVFTISHSFSSILSGRSVSAARPLSSEDQKMSSLSVPSGFRKI